jgi:hypothetical protein
MGSSRHLRVSATGFPGTNQTWRFIQDAWREPLNALALLAGDKTVVTGCIVAGGSMGNGYIVLNGEILPFQAGAIGENITMIKDIINVDYDVDIDSDGNLDNLPAYESRYLRFGSDGENTFPYSELKRLQTIQQLSDYQLPDYLTAPIYVAFTTALLNKLNGIEAGAQVNVQSNWNVTNPLSMAFIVGKPNIINVLGQGNYFIGDISSGTYTVPIELSEATNEYDVFPTFVTTAANSHNSATFHHWAIHSKTTTSFKIHINEIGAYAQSIDMSYLIVKKTII